MMKKLVCLLLICLLAVPSALAYDGTAPVTDETKTISILTTNSGSKQYNFDEMTWWQLVLKNANIELDMEILDDSAYSDAVKPRLAAGVNLPDIVRLPGADSDMSYINSGIFLDLATYFDTLGFNIKKHFEMYPTLKGSLTTPAGGMYYVPSLQPADANMRCIMVNRLYLEKLGMTADDITDIDSLTEFLYKVKENDMNDNGDATDEVPLFIRAGMIGLLRMYWGIDGESNYMLEDGKVICTAIDDRYKDFLTWAHQAYADGLIYNEFSTANYDTQTALYSANQNGSTIHFVSNCTGYSQTIDPEWQFNVDEPIMVPKAIKGPGTNDTPVCWGRSVYSGGGFGITSGCEDPELVFSFLDYLFSEEVGILTWYGIEGIDYNIVDGDYQFTDVYYDNKDNYRGNCGYNCMALPNAYQLYGSKECNQVRAAIDEMSAYVKNPSLGYSYMNDDENEIVNAYSADLETYFTEQMTAFIMGTRSLDEWDAYVSSVKAMGVDELVAVKQAVADRSAN